MNRFYSRLREWLPAVRRAYLANVSMWAASLVSTMGEGRALAEGPLRVEFADVNFSYEADQPIPKGISFSVAPGKVLGLLGRTGSGKTTLLKCLLGLAQLCTTLFSKKTLRTCRTVY